MTFPDEPSPSLHPHYRGFITTTRRSASRRGDGTQPSRFLPLRRSLSPSHLRPGHYPRPPFHVPYESRRPRSRRLYAGHRLANTWAPARLILDSLDQPSSDAVSILSTRQQRSSPWSPPDASSAPFPHRSPRRSLTNAACGGLESSPIGRSRRAISPPSSVEHCIDKRLPTASPLSTFVAHSNT